MPVVVRCDIKTLSLGDRTKKMTQYTRTCDLWKIILKV